MKNVKSKIALASIVLCGSVALGISSLNASVASAATLEGFEVKTAALRVPDGEYGAGIRFTLGLGDVSLAEGATTGVLMIPTASLGGSALTLANGHEDLRTFENVEWKDMGDGTKEAYLHLYDVPPIQYATSISLCAYVDHDADPATDLIYTDVVTASVAEVADWAYYNDASLDEAAKASLQETYLTYKVVYHSEGQVWEETTGVYNEKLTAVEAPTRVGYTFKGWWNKAGTHEWDFDTMKVTSTTTNLYAKWEEDIDPVVAARVGEDANTLLFFDRDFGVSQAFNVTGSNYGYTTTKAYGNEAGSLKITWPNSAIHNTLDLDFKGYAFGANDYVEFYVYNDTNVGTLQMRFGYDNATYLVNGEWTRIIGSASWLASNQYFRFIGQSGNYGSNTNVGGDIYISKVKVYSGFATLTDAATDDWKIGETTFTGKASVYGTAPITAMQSNLYQTANDTVTMRVWSHSYAGFYAKLKTSVDATSEYKYMSITAKGADVSKFTIVGFNTAGAAKTSATYAYTTRDEGNGYVTYIFRFKGFEAGSFRITPWGDTREAAFATTSGQDLIITNVVLGDYTSLRRGSDANTLFFYDTPLAVDLGNMYYKANNNHTSVAYTTEKAYYGERGSTKFAGVKYGANAYALYKTSGAALSAADQAFLKDGDYLSFYVYSTAERKMFFSVYSNYKTTGHKLMPNTWTKIVVPASALAAASSYYFLINDVVGGTASSSSYDLYFSKIVRCSASDVVYLNTNEDTYTIGSTQFVGAASVANGAPNASGVLSATDYKQARVVNGELVLTFTRSNDPWVSLKLAQPIEVAANTEMYMVVTMFNYGRLDKVEGYFLGSANNFLTYVKHTDIGGGYAKVVLKRAAQSSAYTINNVRIDLESHSDGSMATQIVVRDIVVGTSY